MKHLIKTTIITTIILIAATALSSCGDITAGEEGTPPPPAPPNPVEILEERVASERELRLEAEAKAEEEAGSKGRWELATIALAILAIAAFVGGTAIGSKGRRHAGDA